jgi:hypothetical protein
MSLSVASITCTAIVLLLVTDMLTCDVRGAYVIVCVYTGSISGSANCGHGF